MKQLLSYLPVLSLLIILSGHKVYAQSRTVNHEPNPAYINRIQEMTESLTKEGYALGEIPLPNKIYTELPDKLRADLLSGIEYAPSSFDL
ncbi:MAG: hypothetical protein EHM20_02950, partial [Alphaproteobacteria bacterium]